MISDPSVRIQVAWLVLEHFSTSLQALVESEGRDVGVSAVSVLASYKSIALAARGETDPAMLGIPETSMAAFAIHEVVRRADGH